MEAQRHAREAKAGGAGDCFFCALLQGSLEDRQTRAREVRKLQAAAGDRLSFSRASSRDKPWAGKRSAGGGVPVGGGLGARPSWLWPLGRPFHLPACAFLLEDRKSPPFPAGMWG